MLFLSAFSHLVALFKFLNILGFFFLSSPMTAATRSVKAISTSSMYFFKLCVGIRSNSKPLIVCVGIVEGKHFLAVFSQIKPRSQAQYSFCSSIPFFTASSMLILVMLLIKTPVTYGELAASSSGFIGKLPFSMQCSNEFPHLQ